MFFYQNNEPIEFTLVTFMGGSFLDNIVKKIQNQLNIVGIKLNIKQVNSDIFYSDIYYNGENHSFDMLLHARREILILKKEKCMYQK